MTTNHYTASPSGNEMYPNASMPCPKCGTAFHRYEGNKYRARHQYWHCPGCGVPLTLAFRFGEKGERVDFWAPADCRGCKPVLARGTRVMCNGYEGAIVRHYANTIYEIRVPGGVVATSDFEVIEEAQS